MENIANYMIPNDTIQDFVTTMSITNVSPLQVQSHDGSDWYVCILAINGMLMDTPVFGSLRQHALNCTLGHTVRDGMWSKMEGASLPQEL